MSKQVNYNENLCSGAAIRDDKGRRISKLFESPHPKMTVGYAKNLIMPNDPTEQEFNFRQSGGGVIEDGVAVVDKVKGKSLVWNQKVKNATFINTSEWDATYSTFSVSGGIASVTASADGDNYTQQLVPMVVNHIYLYIFMAATDTANKNRECAYIFYGESSNVNVIKAKDDTNWHTYNAIVTCVSNTRNIVRLEVTKVGTSQFKNVSLIDLTQMFGAGNEPATYEEFLQRKPKVADEYAYNEGTIVNNKVEKVVTTGRNLWDEEWELGAYHPSTGEKVASSDRIRSKNMFACLPHTSYYWRIPDKSSGTYMGNCSFYDISRAFISRAPVGPSSFLTVTTPSNARYVAFDLRLEYGTTYNHDICINLSDPAFNGQYEPYEKHELDLSWLKEIKDSEGVKLFEDGIKSAGTVFDEVEKNKAVKRLGSVDLGTLPWNTSWWNDTGCLYVNFVNKKVGTKNIVYPLGLTYGDDNLLRNNIGICGHINNSFIYIGDAKTHSSASEFISSLSGVYAYYELAEPVEVEYDEKNLTYPVVAGGTEEAIASEPSSAFRADIGYGIDAVKTILDLKARVEALEKK